MASVGDGRLGSGAPGAGATAPLAVAADATARRWGDGARLLLAQIGGRWPADGTRQAALCRFVHYREGELGPSWVVDDVAGFARTAGLKTTGGAIQPTLGFAEP
jgi:hypothetical protein